MEINWLTTVLLTLPAIVIGGTFVLLRHMEYKKEENERSNELKKSTRKEITSIRLRAYERLSLMLERTTPEAMIMRLGKDTNPAMLTVMDMQKILLTSLRAEFDHNMSQQIYVSEELWDKIILARDEMAAFINSVALHAAPNANGATYAQTLITAYTQNGITPHQKAMEDLKSEVQRLID